MCEVKVGGEVVVVAFGDDGAVFHDNCTDLPPPICTVP